MTGELDAIGRLVRRLEELAIPYMVTGSMASSHDGRPLGVTDLWRASVRTSGDLPE